MRQSTPGLNGISPARTEQATFTDEQRDVIIRGLFKSTNSESRFISFLRQVGELHNKPHFSTPEIAWGIICHESEWPTISMATKTLREYRSDEFNKTTRVFLVKESNQELLYPIVPKESAPIAIKNSDSQLPLYLFVIGGPQKIPFSITQSLTLLHRVGRLDLSYGVNEESKNECFDKAVDRYCTDVISKQRSNLNIENLSRKIIYFSPKNDDDDWSAKANKYLARPLADTPITMEGGKTYSTVDLTRPTGKANHREGVGAISNLGNKAYGLFFSASHGYNASKTDSVSDKERIGLQGSLVCDEFRYDPSILNPDEAERVCITSRDFTLPSLSNNHSLGNQIGNVYILLACFSAGTSTTDTYINGLALDQGEHTQQLAENSFTSSLSKLLLSNPMGSARAVIGHINEIYSWSFYEPNPDIEILNYRTLVSDIFNGKRIGDSLRPLTDQYIEKFKTLELSLSKYNATGDKEDRRNAFAQFGTMSDLGSLVILGDPAAAMG